MPRAPLSFPLKGRLKHHLINLAPRSVRAGATVPRFSRNISLGRITPMLSFPALHAMQLRLTSVSRDMIYPTRSVPLIPQPSEVCPINWIQLIKSIYQQQPCTDTGCRHEDLPGAMDERGEWQERIRQIHPSNSTWWWSYILVCIYI